MGLGEVLREVKPGQPVTADMFNRLVRAANRFNSFVGPAGELPERLRLVRLTQDIGPNRDTTPPAGDATRSKRSGVVVYYDPDATTQDDFWVDSTFTVPVLLDPNDSKLTSEHGLPYDESDVLLCWWNRQAAAYIPIDRPLIRVGKTSKNPNATAYPLASTSPDTYGLTFVDIDYTETMGDQTPTDADKSADPHAFVHNLGDGFIPEGTLIFVYWCQGQWYTYFSAIGGGSNFVGVQTSNYTASPGDYIPLDSTSGPFDITLPPSPSSGDEVRMSDVGGVTDVNNVTVKGNGSNIHGQSGDLIFNVAFAGYRFKFINSAVGYAFPEIDRGLGQIWNVIAGTKAQYKCNDDLSSTVVIDSSLSGGNNGISTVFTSVISSASGKIGNSFQLQSASNDCVGITAVLNDINTTTAGSWTVWVNLVGTGPGSDIISFGDTANDTHLSLQVNNNEKVSAILRDAGVTQWEVTTDAVQVVAGTFVHLMLIHDGTTPKIYIDNVLVAQTLTGPSQSKWLKDLDGQIDNARFGCGSRSGIGNAAHWNGHVDDVRIINRAITANERAGIFNLALGTEFDSGLVP